MGEEKRAALRYIMYCSVDVNVREWWWGEEGAVSVVVGAEEVGVVVVAVEGEGVGGEEEEGAVKAQGYHCERKPWGPVGRQKKRGAIRASGRRWWWVRCARRVRGVVCGCEVVAGVGMRSVMFFKAREAGCIIRGWDVPFGFSAFSKILGDGILTPWRMAFRGMSTLLGVSTPS